MKKLISLFITISMIFTTVPMVSADEVVVNLSLRSITNKQLAEMVESGEIPQNVTKLRLNNNQITDISPLGKLINLQKLYLNNDMTPGGNAISDITPLSGLTELQVLHL